MHDYTIFYKNTLPHEGSGSLDCQWETFISVDTSTLRVASIYQRVIANRKEKIQLPEYLPLNSCLSNEAEIISSFFSKIDISNGSLCIDITGFLAPYLLFLIKYLNARQIRKFDIIYTEPSFYENKEDTAFAPEYISDIRQISGYEGTHSVDTSNDLLIIGSGYDDQLISAIAENKNHARKVQILGLPSLQPDMYQENVIRADKASEAVGVKVGNEPNNFFAPANDPFVTAQTIKEVISAFNAKNRITNYYLCPLATKPQVLGFGLYYLYECENSPCSIIYPFCTNYKSDTSKGISRIWRYSIELPINRDCYRGLDE